VIEKTEDGGLNIVLAPECTIAEVETDADRCRGHLEELTEIRINSDLLEEIDTAYLQFLMSLKATAEQLGIPFTLCGKTETLDKAMDLFGIGHEIYRGCHVKDNNDRG
jgi:anti-anti-sigma regulatory factor